MPDEKKESEVIHVIQQAKAGLTEWIGRILIAVLAFLAVKIYDKVSDLATHQPMIEFRIEQLENKMERMDNKVFTDNRFQYPYDSPPAKHEEENVSKMMEQKNQPRKKQKHIK